MTQSIEVLSKQLTRDLKVLVKYDDQPSHPRREDDNLFTIAAWHPRHALSDVPEHKTPAGFLRSLGIIGSKDTVEAVRECHLERSKLDPPGMLRKIYM